MADYREILLRKGVVSLDQLSEAEQMAREQSMDTADCLTRLGYAEGGEVMLAMAEQHNLDYVDLTEISIPDEVIELVPTPLARALEMVWRGDLIDAKSAIALVHAARNRGCLA